MRIFAYLFLILFACFIGCSAIGEKKGGGEITGIEDSGKVQAFDSIWKWPNFLKNLLQNFHLDSSKKINSKTNTKFTYENSPVGIQSADIPNILKYLLFMNVPWILIIVVIGWRYFKIISYFKSMVQWTDRVDTTKELKQASKIRSGLDKGFEKMVRKYKQ